MNTTEFNIIFLDAKKRKLFEILDAKKDEDSEFSRHIKYFINRIEQLQKNISEDTKFHEDIDNQFFISKTAVNRIFRDRGWEEVADIYNEVDKIAVKYLENKI